jgi:hypothetical protein
MFAVPASMASCWQALVVGSELAKFVDSELGCPDLELAAEPELAYLHPTMASTLPNRPVLELHLRPLQMAY